MSQAGEQASKTARPSPRLMDITEQIVAAGLYILLVARLWPHGSWEVAWNSLLLLFSEGVVILLLLARRPTDRISKDPRDWAIAAGGTFLALLVSKGGQPLAPAVAGVFLLAGIILHLSAKLCLRRSFGLVAAHRGLKVSGIYKVIRHPMYAGYMLTHIGYLLVSPTWWNLAIYIAVWSLLIARIFAEERILSQDPDYRGFMERVHYRLIPGIF